MVYTTQELNRALSNNEFFLEYIPTVSLQDDRCVGAEALIRWRRGEHIVHPLDFIPFIENTPLSGSLTYWVIDTIGKELRSWLLAQEEVRISINIPPEIVGRGGILYAAEKSGLIEVADKITLELTERGLLDSLGLQAINSVSKSGLEIALDDVKGNNTNLLILSHVPVNIIKLEKAFADRLLEADWS